MKKITIWKEQATTKNLLIALVAFILFMIPMQLILPRVQGSCDSKMMDFLIGYNADTVYYILNSIGESGRSNYLLLIGLDFCFGLIYAALFFLAIALLLKKNGSADNWNKLLLFPNDCNAF